MLKRALLSWLQQASWGRLDITWPDGQTDTCGVSPPFVGHLTIHHTSALWAMATDLQLGFGEAYMDGRIDFRGDLHDLVLFAHYNQHRRWRLPWRPWFQRGYGRATGPSRQTLDIQYHYDLGNDFFSLFLDPSMTYSCAYFRHPSDSLEQAQRQKIDYSLRKLRLRPGERLIDIGSGWGELVLRAAQDHGVEAHGITLSRQQWTASCQRIRHLGLEGRVRVDRTDYRTVEGRYDKLISIGMVEHVGRPSLGAFMDKVAGLLKPGGLALLHHITHLTEEPVNRWTTRYAFPGGYIPSLREVTALLPTRNLHLLDVENLGPHYALTLDRWSDNYERQVDQVRELCAAKGLRSVERFIRLWRLYLRSAAASFRCGASAVHQYLVSAGPTPLVPLTREDLYRTSGARPDQPDMAGSHDVSPPARA